MRLASISAKYIPNFVLVRSKQLNCNVCGGPLEHRLYESGAARSLTSLCTVYDGATQVYFCHRCGHVQSVEISDIDKYYDSDYDILIQSEEEDQIYQVVDGVTVYRTEHQVRTLLEKVSFPAGSRVLDYGCAKSSMMRALKIGNPDIQTYLFDVSDRYIPFWNNFLTADHWATYVIPSNWEGQFDGVTSFFSLEHMARPQDALQQINRLLKTEGTFYGIVPNVFSNTADMIVVDHVNHFTVPSLKYLLLDAGFEIVDIDDLSHRGALTFVARKVGCSAKDIGMPRAEEIRNTFEKADEIARYWNGIGERVKAFESSIKAVDRIAIYGAGVYGAFITSCLLHSQKIVCVIDQNPFLHGRTANGARVVAPAELPVDVRVVLVGLNPAYAEKLIDEIQEFRSRNLEYFFL